MACYSNLSIWDESMFLLILLVQTISDLKFGWHNLEMFLLSTEDSIYAVRFETIKNKCKLSDSI